MRIVVTGATGFLGSKLVHKLADKHEVVALTRTGQWEAPDRMQSIACDLCKSIDLSKLPDKIDSVVHLAQSRRYREFPDGADDMFAVNILGTYNLLEYARKAGAKNFVLASTGSVYTPSPKNQDENSIVTPQDFYGVSKLAAENLLQAYRPFMRASALRLFYLYGSGQTDKLVANLINRVKSGQALAVPGEADGVSLTPTYIDDAVSVFVPAIEQSWDGILNVAGPETVTIRQLGQAIADALEGTASFEMKGGPEPVSVLPDLSRLNDLVDMSAFVTLSDGLRRMVQSNA